MRISQVCDKTIEYSFYLLFVLVPLIMTPFNYELFEFNKMMLVYFLMTIIVAAWLIKMVVQKKIIFRHSFMDIPLLIFLASQSTSTLLSIDGHTSFWGYYSRFHGGLFSTIAYLLLYWAFVSNFSHPRGGGAPAQTSPSEKECWRGRHLGGVIIAMFSSATLVALYGIAEHFGIDAKYWVQDVQNRVFSTLGQPNWLAAYLVALLPIPMAIILTSPPVIANFSSRPKKRRINSATPFYFLYFILILLLYLCLLYTKSRSGLLGFAVAYLLFWSLTFFLSSRGVNRVPRRGWNRSYTLGIRWPTTLKSFSLITILLSLTTLFVGTPWTPNLGQLIQKPSSPPVVEEPSPIPIGGTESGEIRKIVWKGAMEIWRHYPLFGTGVETFAYSYYWHRPREHNDVSEWDFLYNKAHNEYLNYLATTGILGLGSYLLLIGAFVFWNLKQISNFKFLISKQIPNPNDSMSKKLGQLAFRRNPAQRAIRLISHSLLAGFCSILVTNFFGFSVVPVALFFFLFPAMSVILAGEAGVAQFIARPKERRLKSATPLSFWQWFAIGIVLFSLLFSHFSFLKYWYADTLFAKGEKFNDAKQYDSAFNLLQKAVKLRPGEPFYHDELALSAANLGLAELAISESDKALKTSPYHLNFWKNRARVFYALAEIDEKYYQNALESLLTASELAPTDAKISYNLGLMYANIGQDETAIETLERTIELKPNYETARYALALFYEKKERKEEAKKQLEYILEKINPNYQPAIEKLKEF